MLQLNDLRIRLDQMTERIVSRLKDRSRFPLNGPVYRTDGVPIAGRTGISFLEYSLEGLERYHASLGRFNYPDQFPVFSSHLPETPVTRTVLGTPSLPRLQISIKEALLGYYQRELLPRLCAPGNKPDMYGETVYVDADLLQILHERINVGRYVAQAKVDSAPEILSFVDDYARVERELKVPEREEALIRSVRAVAERYALDANLAEDVFRWIIDQTLRLEVVYLQQLKEPSE